MCEHRPRRRGESAAAYRRPQLATCRECRDADATAQLANVPAVTPWVSTLPDHPENTVEHQPRPA